MAGKETLQLYVRDTVSSVFRPHKELKGFAKVDLQPGEETEVEFELSRRAFAFYNPDIKDWQIESGEFEILIGASAQDIRHRETVTIESSQKAPATASDQMAVYHNFPKGSPVSLKDFEELLGSPVPANDGPKKGSYTINTPVGDMTDTFIGRLLYNFMGKQMEKMIQGQEGTPTALLMEAMAKEVPLRSILMSSDGSLTREMLDGIVIMINGQFFKGAAELIKAARAK